MNYFRHSKYNPFFRRELLNYMLGKKLSDIFCIVSNRIRGVESDNYLFQNNISPIILKLENEIEIYLCVPQITMFEIREEHSKNYSINGYVDKADRYGGDIVQSNKNSEKLSLKELQEPLDISTLLGREIVEYFLINETLELQKIIGGRRTNYLGIRGIGLEFSNGETLYLINHFGSIKLGKNLVKICKEIRWGFEKENALIISKNFCKNGSTYKNIEGKEYYCPDKQLDGILIDRKDILPMSLLYVENLYKTTVDSEEIKQMLDSYPELNLNKQLSFLKALKVDMKDNKYGVADIKFGLDKNLNLKLVKPIDVILYVEENILFIDSIIKEFRNAPL